MKKLPLKYSKKWLWILLIYTLILYGSFITTRIILNTQFTSTILSSFAILALLSAVIPCLIGYLGGRQFFIVEACFSVLAILYMFIAILAHFSPGWEDLTSVVGFLFISLLGIVFAIIAQIVSLYIKKPKVQ